MTLVQMKYFQAVCKYENYTKAAQALYVSQPAVSQAIRDLEDECGIALFSRKGNGLVLTEAGRLLLDEVEVILDHMSDLERMISSQGLTRNFVRIGISTFSSASTFPKICAAFHKKFPDIRIASHEDGTPELFQLLNADRVDLIITSPNRRKAELKQDYHLHTLAYSGLRYCVGRSHPWAGRKEVSLEEMAKEPLIMLSENYNSARGLMKEFTDRGLEPNIILRTTQMYTIERFVESGAAGGFLPPEVASANRNIVVLPYPEERPFHHTALLWKRKGILFPAAENFIRVAKAVFPDAQEDGN